MLSGNIITGGHVDGVYIQTDSMASSADGELLEDHDNQLGELLDKIGLGQFKEAFKDNLISMDQIKEMKDSDFEAIGIRAIGTRIKIKQAVQNCQRAEETTPTLGKFLELQAAAKKRKTKSNTVKNSNSASQKPTRRVYMGWKHLCEKRNGIYKVVSLKDGGGQQVIDFPKDYNFDQVITNILSVYFPNGKSGRFVLDQLDYHIASFSNEAISDLCTIGSFTIGRYFSEVRSHPVRWYLHTKMKKFVDSDEDLPDILNAEVVGHSSSDRQNVDETPTRSMAYNENDEGTGTSQDVGQGQTVKQDMQSVASHAETLHDSDDVREAHSVTQGRQVIDSGTPTVVFRQRQSRLSLPRPRPRTEEITDVYRSYVDIFGREIVDLRQSSDEEGTEDLSGSAHQLQTTNKSDAKLFDLLKTISIKTDCRATKFNVTRTNPFDGVRRALNRGKFDPMAPISVRFADDFGMSEGAVDEGGPMRELFRILLKEVKETAVFHGDEKAKMITLQASALREGMYKDVGVTLAMAIVHGGQWPRFFHATTYAAIAYGAHHSHSSLEDLTDVELKHEILKLKQASSLEEIQEVIDSNFLLFSISGCVQPMLRFSIEQRDELVKDLIHFLVIGRNTPAINQLMEGLDMLPVGNLIRNHPEQFKEVFCHQNQKLTADDMEAVFQKVIYSDPMSNKRRGEEKTMTHWCDYLMDIEDGKAEITLEQLLAFATGTDQIPFLGFANDPTLDFLHNAQYPTANTCAMILRLPVHQEFETFKDNMDFGIQNSPGFGMA